MPAPLRPDESECLRELAEYDVLDTLPERVFDDLVHLAAHVCGAPIALLTVLDEHRQWFKARIGLDAAETPRDVAFCAHAVLRPELLVVRDAWLDERFADNPLVRGEPFIRFYAGMPLSTSEGRAIGTLCVIDRVPRVLGAEQEHALRVLASTAMAHLELRRNARALRHALAERDVVQRALSSEHARFEERLRQRTAELAASEARARRLVEANIVGIIVADTTGRILEANDAFLALLGFARSDLADRTLRWDTITPPEWRAVDDALIADLQAHGIARPREKEYFHKDGRRVPILVGVALLEGSANECVCFVIDLTERRRAEENLRESEDRLRRAFDGLGQHIFAGLLRLDGTVLLANRHALEVAGLDPKDVLGRPVETTHWWSYDERVSARIRDAVERAAKGERVRYEERIRAAQDQFIWIDFSVQPIRDERGAVEFLLPSGFDITERRRVEQEQTELHGRLTTVLESMSDAFVAIDAQWVYTYINSAAARLLQIRREDALGRNCWEVFPQSVGTDFHHRYMRCMAEQKPAHFEVHYESIDAWYEVHAHPSPEGLVIYFTDIRERKQQQEERRKHREVAEWARVAHEANRFKSEFLSGMSHELRTPLNSVIGFTQLLVDGKAGPIADRQREYLNDVLAAGQHLLQLINDVLDLAKIEAGKIELHPEPLDVQAIIEDVASVLRALTLERQVVLRCSVARDLGRVVLDARSLKQVLYNLLSNAIKFSHEGGCVDLAAQRMDAWRMELRVRDRGIGIRADDLPRLFQDFQQLDTGHARRHAGTGLGLSLTKRIVELQRGTITVETAPGLGSTFIVVLPIGIAEASSACVANDANDKDAPIEARREQP
ncbi:MAG: PAS domain S-box protein [Planctomycetes bacterium]|nr:PAS domain S-box protein [Planctomycetota bacterium]